MTIRDYLIHRLRMLLINPLVFLVGFVAFLFVGRAGNRVAFLIAAILGGGYLFSLFTVWLLLRCPKCRVSLGGSAFFGSGQPTKISFQPLSGVWNWSR